MSSRLILFQITCYIKNYGAGFIGITTALEEATFTPVITPILVLASHEDIVKGYVSKERPSVHSFGTKVLLLMPYALAEVAMEKARLAPTTPFGYNLSRKHRVVAEPWRA